MVRLRFIVSGSRGTQWLQLSRQEKTKNGSIIAGSPTFTCSTSSISRQVLSWKSQPGLPYSTRFGVKNGGASFASAGQVSIAGALSVWSTACTGRKPRLRKSEMRSKRPTTLTLRKFLPTESRAGVWPTCLRWAAESTRASLPARESCTCRLTAWTRLGVQFFPKKHQKTETTSQSHTDCFAALFFGQAKFKCPRFGPTLRSKLEEKLWRPTLHNVGIILFGLSELYYLADCVDKKDSNNQATVLSILPANSSPMHLMYLLVDPKLISIHVLILPLSAQWGMALERASEMLREKGSNLPRHIVIQSDNTCRETRNQVLVKWAAHLICSNICDSISFCFFKVGHTHCEIDQRFSVLAHCLNQATGLQTPQDQRPNIIWLFLL